MKRNKTTFDIYTFKCMLFTCEIYSFRAFFSPFSVITSYLARLYIPFSYYKYKALFLYIIL